MDAMRAEVALVSCVYDPVFFCDLMDNSIVLFKFSTALGGTTVKFQDPDSVISVLDDPELDPSVEHLGECSALTDMFASATHAEKLKDVDSELIQRIWRIGEKTEKRMIKTTTELEAVNEFWNK